MLNYMSRKQKKIKNKIKDKRQMKVKLIKKNSSSLQRYDKGGI